MHECKENTVRTVEGERLENLGDMSKRGLGNGEGGGLGGWTDEWESRFHFVFPNLLLLSKTNKWEK